MYGRDTPLRMQLQRGGTAEAYRNLISLCHPLPCAMCLRLANNANAAVGNAGGARGRAVFPYRVRLKISVTFPSSVFPWFGAEL